MLSWVGWWVGDITCIFFVPMSTIVDHRSMIVPPPVARGAYVTHAPIPPPGGAPRSSAAF